METAVKQGQHGIQVPAPGIWTLDPTHTTVGFVARHMMVSKVRGRFNGFDGKIQIGATPEESSLEVTLDAASIDTGTQMRDDHLRSADFFDVEKYPTLTFRSSRVRQTGDTTLEIEGDLTIRDITKPVTLEAEYEGVAPDGTGGTRAGFSARAEIDREEWDLRWNMALEAGGLAVSKKIKLEIDVELLAAE